MERWLRYLPIRPSLLYKPSVANCIYSTTRATTSSSGQPTEDIPHTRHIPTIRGGGGVSEVMCCYLQYVQCWLCFYGKIEI